MQGQSTASSETAPGVELRSLDKVNFTEEDIDLIYNNDFSGLHKVEESQVRQNSPRTFALASRVLLEDLKFNFQAKHLQYAVSNTHYCMGSGDSFTSSSHASVDGTNYHALLTPLLTFGFYSLYRWVKSVPRTSSTQPVTDENFKQVLLDILNDWGNEDKNSYKWDILKNITHAFCFMNHNIDHRNYHELAKHKLLDKIVNHYIFFSDDDVKDLIDKTKKQLTEELAIKQAVSQELRLQ